MISAIEAMSNFSGSLNRPSKFKTAQGFGPTPDRLPPSFTLPTIASSLATTAGVLPVVAGSPAPPVGEDRGASGQSTRVSSEPLSFA